MQFRKRMIAGYVRDFAQWVTTSAAPQSNFTIPSARFYSHQIPSEFLFERPGNIRIATSASAAAALRRLSSSSPLVVAIDDVQWLDPVSAGALRYAFRRLDREPQVGDAERH